MIYKVYPLFNRHQISVVVSEKQQLNIVISIKVLILLVTVFIGLIIVAGPETLSSILISYIANIFIVLSELFV
jgi:hypothetical protein